MDIFKRLTKGIKLAGHPEKVFSTSVDKESHKRPQEANVHGVLPQSLDFFATSEGKRPATDLMPLAGQENTATTTLPAPRKKARRSAKALFSEQDKLERFRQKHAIRLSLHQTSDSTASSETLGTHLHHLTQLEDPDQILPVRKFDSLGSVYGLDSRVLDWMQQVTLRETATQDTLHQRQAELLLSPTDIATLVSRPTPVQMQATPVLLRGRDVIVVAPTGSGKTLVFILGILGRLLAQPAERLDSGKIQALVISPTRELSEQTHAQFLRFVPRGHKGRPLLRVSNLTKAVVNGWAAQPPATFPHVLVATPLRLIHAIRAGIITIDALEMLVLDEADRLLADGFDEQLDDVLVAMKTPARVQKALFSATMPSGAEATARSILSAPYRVLCGHNPNCASHAAITQQLVYCGSPAASSAASDSERGGFDEGTGKLMSLRQLIAQGKLTPPVLIFVGSTVRAERLYRDLVSVSVAGNRPLLVDCLHSGRSQAERTAVLDAFRANRIWFLITTDVLARGLDFPPLSAVINYDFPDTTATYIHRIGRTGRAGRSGLAYTFYTTHDLAALRIVVNVMRESGSDVPEWLSKHYSKTQGRTRLQKKLAHRHSKDDGVTET